MNEPSTAQLPLVGLLDGSGRPQDGQPKPRMEFTEIKTEAARRLGVEAERLREMRLSIKQLRQTGALIDLDVRGITMFSTTSSWAEFGIPEDDQRARSLTKGERYLIQPELVRRLRSLETRFRASLEKYSFDVAAFGRSWRWVPYTAYGEWKKEWLSLQEEWMAVKSTILDNLDDYRDNLAREFAIIADEAWQAMAVRHNGSGSFVVIVAGKECQDSDAFQQVIVDTVLAKMPTHREIEVGLHVDYVPGILYTDADLEEEWALQAQAQARREAADSERQVIQEKLDAERRMQNERIAAERRRLDILEEQERVRLHAMRTAEIEKAREKIKNVATPYEEIIEQLRARVNGEVVELLESVRKHGGFRGRMAERVRGLVELSSLLNSHGDEELEEKLAALKNSLDRPDPAGGGKYDVAAVEAALTEVADITTEAARRVASRAGRRFANIEV